MTRNYLILCRIRINLTPVMALSSSIFISFYFSLSHHTSFPSPFFVYFINLHFDFIRYRTGTLIPWNILHTWPSRIQKLNHHLCILNLWLFITTITCLHASKDIVFGVLANRSFHSNSSENKQRKIDSMCRKF